MPEEAAEKLETILRQNKKLTKLHDIGRTGTRLVVTRRDLEPVAAKHFRIISAAVRKAKGKRELTSTLEPKGNYIAVAFSKPKS